MMYIMHDYFLTKFGAFYTRQLCCCMQSLLTLLLSQGLGPSHAHHSHIIKTSFCEHNKAEEMDWKCLQCRCPIFIEEAY